MPETTEGHERVPRDDSQPAISGFDHSGGKIHYGGQAVIEGVMMRGPTAVATAVRLPDGRVSVRREDFTSVSRKNRLLRLPVIRGGLTLIESLALGIKALNYSASVAIESADEDGGEEEDADGGVGEGAAGAAPEGVVGSVDREASETGKGAADSAPEEESGEGDRQAAGDGTERPDWKTNVALTGTMVFALALGIVIFFWIPMVLSDFLTDAMGTQSGVLFNLIDGVIRVVFFLAYLWGISRWKEMRRVFEYHGAEHQVIFAQEEGEELTPENASKFTTRHPRCGTSFLLIVMVVSILVFMIFGKPPTIGLRLARLLMIPVIAGVSYEVMKLSARHADQMWARFLAAPGVWLQRITTKVPSEDQIEVAIAALEAVRVDQEAPAEAG
ncbi:MAG: DUF1385 domain-containing protein [Candidatus Eisenbacteria bacterium]|nr:DUF1385 domain-containing protein [Candidatus Eisenbacteria bacterium]